MAGMEFIYMNGKYSLFAKSEVKNQIFASSLDGNKSIARGTPGVDPKFLRFQDHKEATFGLEDSDMLANNLVHAIHIPGAGSELLFKNLTLLSYDSAFLGCAWCSTGRGDMKELENITLLDVNDWVSFSHWELGSFWTKMEASPDQQALGIVPASKLTEANENCRKHFHAYRKAYK